MPGVYQGLGLASLVLAVPMLAGCFLALLLGWPVHAFIAALLFNAFFVLWRELSGLSAVRGARIRARRMS
jgi:hypothetical protein